MLRNLLLTALACCILTSCDVEDERDVCCKHILMEYHYMRDGQDKFSENIRIMRHFLFDGRERFIREIHAGNNLQQLQLDSLKAGNYVMVAVGNAADATRLETPPAGSCMEDFVLKVAESNGQDTDPLYYGICRFAPLRENAGRLQHFVTQMSNVHCKLKVTVKWQNLPPVLTTKPIYRMTLENCAADYELDAANGYAIDEKQFPYSPNWMQEHRKDCALDSRQLKQTFISLRYTNENLPLLRIFCRKEGEYVEQTPALDLKKAFRSWGYRPSTAERQDYRIVVTIYRDGHVGVKVEMETGIADWVDGGSFG